MQLEPLLVHARLAAVGIDGDARDIDEPVDADEHQRFEMTLAGPDFDTILLFLEIHRARADPGPARREARCARALWRGAQSP